MVAFPLNFANHLTHVISGPWLHTVDWIKSGNRKIQEEFLVLRHSWYHDITTEFFVLISLSSSPTPRQKIAWEVALFTSQQHHHVLPWLMYLRHVMYLFRFHLLR